MREDIALSSVRAAIQAAAAKFGDGAERFDWARDVNAVGAREVADELDVGCRYLAAGVVSQALEGSDLLDELRLGRWVTDIRRLPEFGALVKDGVMVDSVYDLNVTVANGAPLRCKAVKVPEIEQDTHDAQPYRIIASLPVWLGLDREQRQAALHAALCLVLEWHLGEKRGRVSAHPATLARFGPQSSAEAEMLAHAMSRPELAAEVRRFGYDGASGQGLLFGDGSKVEVPSNAPVLTVSTPERTVSITAEQAARAADRIKRL
jgi:hypothetical protein